MSKDNLTTELCESTRTLKSQYDGLANQTRALISAVERYVAPKPGEPYLHRSELLRILNKAKQAL